MIRRLLAALFRSDEGAGYDTRRYADLVRPRPADYGGADLDPARVAEAFAATRATHLEDLEELP